MITTSFLRSLVLLAFVFFSSHMAFSQSGPKWATEGNLGDAASFVGTTNAFSLLFKTNNVQWMSLNTTGILQVNSLAGPGTGFASIDADGNLYRTSFPNDPYQVLTGNGTFSTFSSVGGWAFSGNNLYNSNTGYVGIGTNNPQYLLDVNGNARVNGTLYALGLVLATKMQADTMKSTTMISVNNNLNFNGGLLNEIYTYNGDVRMQSRIGYNGNTILNAGTTGNVGVGIYNPVAKLDVNGNMRLNGTLNFPAMATGSPTQVYIDGSGNLLPVPILPNACNSASIIDWNTRGNAGTDPFEDFLGTCDEASLVFRTFNLERMRISSSGDVGIGTSMPLGRLDVRLNVNDQVGLPAAFFTKDNGQTLKSFWIVPELASGSYNPISQQGDIGIFWSDGALPDGKNYNSSFVIAPFSNSTHGIRITSAGDVGIGLNNPQYKLDVCGTIRAKEIRVNTTGCDFVFEPQYNLMSFDSLSLYLKNNKHLPGVPTAKEMESNNGVALGELNSVYLRKIEELSLYVLELHAQNVKIQNEINELKTKVK